MKEPVGIREFCKAVVLRCERANESNAGADAVALGREEYLAVAMDFMRKIVDEGEREYLFSPCLSAEADERTRVFLARAGFDGIFKQAFEHEAEIAFLYGKMAGNVE